MTSINQCSKEGTRQEQDNLSTTLAVGAKIQNLNTKWTNKISDMVHWSLTKLKKNDLNFSHSSYLTVTPSEQTKYPLWSIEV